MNRNSKLFVFIFTPLEILFLSQKVLVFLTGFIFSLCLFFPKLNAGQELPFANPEATISMDLQDASLKDVLKIFSIQSGLNFIASEIVQDRKTTVYLDKAPIKEAMDKLFKSNNLSYELDRDSNIFVVKDWGKPKIETVTKVFYLKYATVSSSPLKSEVTSQMSTTSAAPTGGTAGGGSGITNAIKVLLSEFGSVIEDYRTNSIIITDIPSRMGTIAQVIASLDVPQPQVMLEVEMLDVSKDTVDRLGFDFSNNPITLILPGGFARRGAEFFLGTMARRKNRIDSSGVSGSVVLGSTFGQALDFLRTQTDTKYLARPRILTLNNETAEIKIATNESIGVKETTTAAEGTGTTTAEAERSETGVILRVTPQANIETGEITMFIYPKVSEAVQGNPIQSASLTYQFRDPEERSTKSTVRVKDGETIIVGGLIRNELSQITTKLPILGDIPIIGALFRHRHKSKDRQRELLVFITPHIIKDTIELAQSKKVAIPNREQDTVSAVDREVAINEYLNSFEKKNK